MTFLDELRTMAGKAHELERATEAAHAQEDRERQEAVAHAYRLAEEIEVALRQVARDPALPITVEVPNPRPADTRGWAGWTLTWTDPLPDRILEIEMYMDDRRLQWAWWRPANKMRWHQEDTSYFTVEQDLRELLVKLCDHEAWKTGRLPGSE